MCFVGTGVILLMAEIQRAPVEVGRFGSSSHSLQGFIHLRWLAGFLPSTGVRSGVKLAHFPR